MYSLFCVALAGSQKIRPLFEKRVLESEFSRIRDMSRLITEMKDSIFMRFHKIRENSPKANKEVRNIGLTSESRIYLLFGAKKVNIT
jgi:hypothetical protein